MSRPGYGFGDIVYGDGPASSLVAKLQYSGPVKVVWYIRQPELIDDDYDSAIKMINNYLEFVRTAPIELPPVMHE